jgi:molybdate transport system substrate-binding protein
MIKRLRTRIVQTEKGKTMLTGFTPKHFLITAIVSLLMPTLALAEPRELLIYCGITMVKPVSEMARAFEQQQDVKIIISQGGSEDLYNSLKTSQKGDIYLPGEPSFRTKYLSEGLLGDFKNIGYNQAALFVRKDNPKQVTADVKQLLRPDLTVLVAAERQGSIGSETKRILMQAGIYDRVVDNASQVSPDSRTLNATLKKGEADITLNWRATAFFPENRPYIDVIDLPVVIAKPQALLMNRVTISQQPRLAQQFIDYAASPAGQVIMRQHGFLDNTTPLN